MRLLISALTIVLLASPVSPLRAAATFEDLERIRQTAHEVLSRQALPAGTKQRIEVSQLDPRLRLTACPAALEGFLPAGATNFGQTRVGVRCNGPQPWTLYVPARVKRVEHVLIAARPLAGGSIVRSEDILTQELEIGDRALAYFTQANQAMGRTLRTAVAAGTRLTPSHFEAQYLVRRGSSVTVIAQGAGIQVRSRAEALADAGPGDRIQVRNPLTRKVIEGVVTPEGQVEVRI